MYLLAEEWSTYIISLLFPAVISFPADNTLGVSLCRLPSAPSDKPFIKLVNLHCRSPVPLSAGQTAVISRPVSGHHLLSDARSAHCCMAASTHGGVAASAVPVHLPSELASQKRCAGLPSRRTRIRRIREFGIHDPAGSLRA